MMEMPADYFGVDLSDSTTAKVRANDDESRRALYNLRQPTFICLVDRPNGKLKIYQTLRRFSSYWTDRKANVEFVFKAGSKGLPLALVSSKTPGKSTPASTTAQALAALELKVKIYCGAPIIEASHSDFENPIKSQINLALYREILEDWIEFDNQAIAWKISKLPVVPHVNSYQTNKPPGKTASLICQEAEPQLARVLQSGRAMASITRLCADALASGKYSRVTPMFLSK